MERMFERPQPRIAMRTRDGDAIPCFAFLYSS